MELQSTNGGSTWTTSALFVRSGGGCGGSSLLKRVTASATEWLHEDYKGRVTLTTDTTGTVTATGLYDVFGVARIASVGGTTGKAGGGTNVSTGPGPAPVAVPIDDGTGGDEGTVGGGCGMIATRQISFCAKPPSRAQWGICAKSCINAIDKKKALQDCVKGAAGAGLPCAICIGAGIIDGELTLPLCAVPCEAVLWGCLKKMAGGILWGFSKCMWKCLFPKGIFTQDPIA